MPEPRSKFQKAVEACSDLTFREGLQAIAAANRGRICPTDPRSVTGSIDIDKDLQRLFPKDNRWDYAVGYRRNDAEESVYFIEVHPAETGEVRRVIAKVRHLKAWAGRNTHDLWNMTVPREIHWVASGRVNLRMNDSYKRLLAMEGLDSPKKCLVLE